jgi:CopG family nickel-responsive transcriptional regulator
MAGLQRFGVSMDEELLREFDGLIAKRGYSIRSEAIRDLIREELARQAAQDPATEVAASLAILYSHHDFERGNLLNRLQHQHHEIIVCTTHVHLDEHTCLEVIILRGASEQVRSVADALVSRRGVRQGHLTCIPLHGLP